MLRLISMKNLFKVNKVRIRQIFRLSANAILFFFFGYQLCSLPQLSQFVSVLFSFKAEFLCWIYSLYWYATDRSSKASFDLFPCFININSLCAMPHPSLTPHFYMLEFIELQWELWPNCVCLVVLHGPPCGSCQWDDLSVKVSSVMLFIWLLS